MGAARVFEHLSAGGACGILKIADDLQHAAGGRVLFLDVLNFDGAVLDGSLYLLTFLAYREVTESN